MFRRFALLVLIILLPGNAVSGELTFCTGTLTPVSGPVGPKQLVGNTSVSRSVFGRLMERNPTTGVVSPSLAESIEVNTDATEFTVVLRKGVSFHPDDRGNRKPLLGEDVAATFDHLLDSGNPDRGYMERLIRSDRFKALGQIDRIEVLDAYSVKFRMKSPQPEFLGVLSEDVASIQSQAYLSRIDSGEKHARPVGTGPFMLGEVRPGESVSFVADGEHWLGKPAFDSVRMLSIRNENLVDSLLASGECDVATLPKKKPDSYPKAKNAGANYFPDLGLVARKQITCFGAGGFGVSDLASCFDMNDAAFSGKCPKCPKSGACPQSVLAAQKDCCPKSGACTQ